MTLTPVKLWNEKPAPRIGIGTWVMGGEQYWGDKPTGWSGVDDDESLRALAAAFEMGVRIIDTADQYGAGHSERIISRAISESSLPRDAFSICTKVGMVCDPDTGNITGTTDKGADITAAIDGSLKRLGVAQLDLVKFHLNGHPVDQSEEVFEAFSAAHVAGKVAGFGWSTDDVDGALAYVKYDGYVAVQHDLNLFAPAEEMLQACERNDLWAFTRQPLAMGLLSGKYSHSSAGKGKDDIRGSGFEWLRYFNADGTPTGEMLDVLEDIRDLLTADGRTVAQGALGWCLAKSDRTIPLPGCRTVAQVRDNFGVIEAGPLAADIVALVDEKVKIVQP